MKLLTLARDLQRRRARERQHLFVAEGVRAVEELLRSGLEVQGAIVTHTLASSPRGAALRASLDAGSAPVLEVDARDFASAASTDSPQGVLVIAAIPQRTIHSLGAGPHARLLILDGVQDPGNVGTLIRTAAAFGVSATLAMPGTVDFWNGKVVRSAMGALFHHPVLNCTWDELDRFLAEHEIPAWGADAGGEPLERIFPPFPEALAIAVGNEGAGLSPAASERVTRRIAIRTRPNVESLNVAVAAGIFLHHFQS